MQPEVTEHLITRGGDLMLGLAAMITAVFGGWLGLNKFRYERTRRQQVEVELSHNNAALELATFLRQWGSISHVLSDLIKSTEIDRILIFRAWNGRFTPRWTTSVYQFRDSNQEPIPYEHFELDGDYVSRLRNIISAPEYYTVEDMPPSEIKDVYEAEGINASYWLHISSHQSNNIGGIAQIYVSFSTHDDTGISPHTQTLCRMAVGQLKGLALAFAPDDQAAM